MSEKRRLWVVRVAQEFLIEATVSEAYDFLGKAAERKMKGARLIDNRGAIAPGPDPAAVEEDAG